MWFNCPACYWFSLWSIKYQFHISRRRIKLKCSMLINFWLKRLIRLINILKTQFVIIHNFLLFYYFMKSLQILCSCKSHQINASFLYIKHLTSINCSFCYWCNYNKKDLSIITKNITLTFILYLFSFCFTLYFILFILSILILLHSFVCSFLLQ